MERPLSSYGIVAGALLTVDGLWQGIRTLRRFLDIISVLGREAAADPMTWK
jgi:hypothetical protein